MTSRVREGRVMNTVSPRLWPCLGSGQVMAIVAISIVMLLAMAGLVIDVGRLWLARQQMQAATDAAAKAGAAEIANQDPADAQSAGIFDATQNGFTAGKSAPTGGTVTSVAVNDPPTAGPYAGQSGYVEGIITASVPTYFLRFVGINSVPISTRATAKPSPAPVCIWTLDQAAQHSLVIGNGASSGAVTVNTPNCMVVVDSDNNDPTGTHGGSCLVSLQIYSSGGWQDDGGCSLPTPQQDVPR